MPQSFTTILASSSNPTIEAVRKRRDSVGCHGGQTDRLTAFCNSLMYLTFQSKDGPDKKPELTVEFPTPPSTVEDGTKLSAFCIVYPGDAGSLVWVIYSNTQNRTLMNHVDQEIVSENSNIERGRVFTKSDLVLPMDMSMNGGRIACFAYDVRRAASLACHASDKFCAITPVIEVKKEDIPGMYTEGVRKNVT
ncbi:hypothetical protein ElyMa_000333500 [Elysia marginata]|uniref:Ig-like domain-containing protein n=1 Tax=Elysia marginata TaxID=1093978 RepID=A0AAV4FD90_9GAST|nr:hypothetical protein ElyMa_000333500 [Elysia marginata]